MRSRTVWIVIAASLLISSPGVAEDPPTTVNFQGTLETPNGIPWNGIVGMQFGFFDAETGGEYYLDDTHNCSTDTVHVNHGLFSVALGGGFISPGYYGYLDLGEVLKSETPIWLEVRVDWGCDPLDYDYEILTPRILISDAPSAITARSVSAGGITDGTIDLATGDIHLGSGGIDLDDGNINLDDGSVTIGTGSIGIGTGNIGIGIGNITIGTGDISITDGDIRLESGKFIGDGSGLTNLDAGALVGTIDKDRLPDIVTLQGNLFNGADQLVQLDPAGALPVLDGSQLTGVVATEATHAADSSTLEGVSASQFLRGDQVDTASERLTFTADPVGSVVGDGSLYVNPASADVDETLLGVAVGGTQKARLDAEGDLQLAGDLVVDGMLQGVGTGLSDLNASNLVSGVVNTSLLPADVTKQGNLFNQSNQLVQLDAVGALPGLDGSQLTGVDADEAAHAADADALEGLSASQFLRGDQADTASERLTFTADPFGSVVGDGSLYVNPASADPDETLFGVAVDGTQKARLDAEGDLRLAGDLVVDGALQGVGTGLTDLNASNLAGGVVDTGLLQDDVTKQGNAFNQPNQLVQLDATGALPGLDGSQLTDVDADEAAHAADADALEGLSASQFLRSDQADTASERLTFTADPLGSVVGDGSLYVNPPTADPDETLLGVAVDGTQKARLDAEGDLRLAGDLVVDGALQGVGTGLTDLNASNLAGGVVDTGLLQDDVTKQGNAFNQPNQLVQLDATGALPAVDGSNLTDITTTHALTLDGLLPTQFLRSDAADTASERLTFAADPLGAVVGDGSLYVNPLTADPDETLLGVAVDGTQKARLDAEGDLRLAGDLVVDGALQGVGTGLTDLNASNLAGGVVDTGLLQDDVTKQGNAFNQPNQLVQLDATGALPVVDGSNLTNITTTHALTLDGLLPTQFLRSDEADTASERLTFTADPLGVVVGDGSLYVNPLTADPDETLLGVAVDGTQKARLDAEGDLQLAGNLVVDGTLQGAGTGLTDLSASNLTGGVVDTGLLQDDVTKQGNLFNQPNQLVQLDATGALPAVDGSNLTGLTTSNALTLDGLLPTQFLRSDQADTASDRLTFTADPLGTVVGDGSLYVNPQTADPDETLLGVAVDGTPKARLDAEGDLRLAGDLVVDGTLQGAGTSLTDLNASNLASGEVDTGLLQDDVTTQGNDFNQANQLVQLDATGALPGLDGSQLTEIISVDSLMLGGLLPSQFLRGDQDDTANGRFTFAGGPLGALVGDGSLHINPATANADETLLGVAVGGTQKARLDAEGDLRLAGDLVVDGALQGVGSGLTDLDASNLSTGEVDTNLLKSDVTKQGNEFNQANQLVQLDAGGALPGLDGSNLTGTVAVDSQLLGGLSPSQFLRSDQDDTAEGHVTFSETPTPTVATVSIHSSSTPTSGNLLDLATEGQKRGWFSAAGDLALTGELQFINSGGSIGSSIEWRESDNRLSLSEGLEIRHVLIVGETSEPFVGNSFNRMQSWNTEQPRSNEMDETADLFVAGDQEVGGRLFLNKDLYMDGAESHPEGGGEQTIWFHHQDDRNSNYIRWDDDTEPYLQDDGIDVAFISSIDGAAAGWSWDRNGDSRMCLDRQGNLQTDGTQTAQAGCDLAETFLGSESLDAGTVVVVDASLREGVLPSVKPYDATVVGVVSPYAGMILSGPTADFLPHAREMDEILEQLEVDPEDEGLLSALDELDQMKSSWPRGNLPVALVGRVMVKVDGRHGAIAAGDRLTTSPIPGHAMLLDRPGPYFGIALEGFEGAAGAVLVLLQSGWYGDIADGDQRGTSTASVNDSAEVAADGKQSDQAGTMRPGVAIESLGAAARGADAAGLVRVDEQGNLYTKGALRPRSMDVAEYFNVDEPVEPGDVLVADRTRPGFYGLARTATDPAVVGVVSADPGVLLGGGVERIASADADLARRLELARATGDEQEESRLWKQLTERFDSAHAPVALSGTVLCKVDAGFGEIAVGDLLTTSPTPGHAMRASEVVPGTIIGKALEPLETSTGTVRILVMMR